MVLRIMSDGWQHDEDGGRGRDQYINDMMIGRDNLARDLNISLHLILLQLR